MRVLHLIHGEGVYGAELILVYLAREMQRLGHEAIIGSIRDPGTPTTPFEEFVSACGLAVKPVRIPPRPTPCVVKSLLRITREVEADVVHSHGYKADILLGLLPRRWRGPMLTTAHGWTSPPRFTALWLYQAVDRVCLRGLDKVVVVGGHMLSIDAVRGLPPGKCVVIENGIPSLEERLADYSRRGIGEVPASVADFVGRRPTLVAIGRLSREKGFDVLIDAFAQACATDGLYQLAIIGDGPERAALLRQASRLRMTERILMPGYVDCADRILDRAKGFVMSSFTEGMPLALLEAMQWRVPIVATAVGAIPELLDNGGGGRLVPPNDTLALCEALHGMMSQGTTNYRLAETAHRLVTSRYSSTRMAMEYLAAYEGVLNASV